MQDMACILSHMVAAWITKGLRAYKVNEKMCIVQPGLGT